MDRIINSKPKESPIVSWEEFRETGLLWYINQQLHLFGYAIQLYCNKNNIVKKVNVVKTEYRGFSEEINDECYKKITLYLKDNIDNLLKNVY